MSNGQLFFALAALMLTLTALSTGFLKYYIDAKVDPVAKQVSETVQYMILHEGKIATVEERTKNL
ncbi:MAG: hypothetical protein ACRD19_08205 [Terriglobia bacterium]